MGRGGGKVARAKSSESVDKVSRGDVVRRCCYFWVLGVPICCSLLSPCPRASLPEAAPELVGGGAYVQGRRTQLPPSASSLQRRGEAWRSCM